MKTKATKSTIAMPARLAINVGATNAANKLLNQNLDLACAVMDAYKGFKVRKVNGDFTAEFLFELKDMPKDVDATAVVEAKGDKLFLCSYVRHEDKGQVQQASARVLIGEMEGETLTVAHAPEKLKANYGVKDVFSKIKQLKALKKQSEEIRAELPAITDSTLYA